MAKNTTHTAQRTELARCRRGAKWCRTRHTQQNAPSEHTGQQEPSGPGHRTRNTAHGVGTPVYMGEVAKKTGQATQRSERALP